MNQKHYLGKRVSSLEEYDVLGPITGVSLAVDDENEYFSGTEDGYVLDVDCSYGTQEIADSILAKVSGKTYSGYRATGAQLGLDSELGDGVTVDGLYSLLAYQKLDFSSGHMSEIAAPGENAVDHEYPYTSETEQAISRTLAEAKSLITKTSEEILLQVEATDGRVTSLSTSVDGIESRVSDAESNISSVSQKVDSITLSVSNGSTSSTISLTVDGVTISSQSISMSGLVTYTGLSSGTTTIDGGCIKTGTISAERINLTGAISWSDLDSSTKSTINGKADSSDIPTKTSQLTNNSGFIDESEATSITKSTVTAAYINAFDITAKSLKGGSVSLLTSSGSYAGDITLSSASSGNYAVDIESYAALRLTADSGDLYMSGGSCNLFLESGYIGMNGGSFCCTGTQQYLGDPSYGIWRAVYAQSTTISTSDRNRKNSVEALPEKYLDMMADLEPVRFKFNDNTSDRYHVGYVAQQVEEAMEKNGVDSQEFGGFVKDTDGDGNEIYMLRYEEFIAIHTKAIQNINKRLEAAGI